MPSFKYFNVRVSPNGITHVEINRPKTHNSFNEESWTEYYEVFKYLSTETSTKVIILSGVGPNFSSGIDLNSVVGLLKSSKAGSLNVSYIHHFQKCIAAPVEFDIPVISVSHGITYGLALDIISATSIRIASRDAKFSIKEIDIGIMADIGSLQRLPVIGGNASMINEFALTARDFTADEAREAGIVSDILDTKEQALERAQELAELISSKYAPAVKGTKKHLDLMNVGTDVVKRGLELVGTDNAALMNDPGYSKFFVQKYRKLAAKL
jgi:delta(3,5)-delta(2,4)-dienoyl-CoA isomerase